MEKKRKFETNGKCITIPLNYKGYEVTANIMRTDKADEFTITYSIGCVGYSNIDRIEGDVFTINSQRDTNWDVYRLTMDKFAAGYFKPFMDRYEFEMTAMNKGIELIELEKEVTDEM